MAVYAWLCYFPRMVLLIPHAVAIGAILATYPYAGKEQTGGARSMSVSDNINASKKQKPTTPVEGEESKYTTEDEDSGSESLDEQLVTLRESVRRPKGIPFCDSGLPGLTGNISR